MVIVQTTRRAGASYLADTLAQLGHVGSRRHMIVSDGPLPDGFTAPADWETAELPWRGARATGWACFKLALDDGCKDLVLLQDDLRICVGGSDVLDRVVVPPACVAVSFYTPFTPPGFQASNFGSPRLIQIRACGTAQALKFSRAALEYLCGLDPLTAPNIPPLLPHYFDDALFALARVSPFSFVAEVMPNPVEHVGAVSACGTKRSFEQPWVVPMHESFPADPAVLPVVPPP